MFNSLRDSLQGMSVIYDWGSEYFRSTNALGHNLHLSPGLASPLDDYNRVACLISNRSSEGYPGFAVCTTAATVQCFAGWRAYVNPDTLETTLVPTGDPLYSWDVALPLGSWRDKAAFFCGDVPGVILSL
jgi:hypothetical protein